MRSQAALALVAAGTLAAAAAADEAHVRIPVALAARVQTGEHGGATVALEVDERGPLVTISQQLRPLPALPAYPLAHPAACGDAAALEVVPPFSLPAELARLSVGTGSALDVLTGVVAYVSRRVVLDPADRGPQDGASVLRRGRARCSGRANATVGLLRAAGIPARVVHGLVMAGREARWHRWGEAWLGPLGWLPFDPGTGAGVVSVRYLPCRAVIPGLQPQGVTLEHIEEDGFRGLPRRAGLAVPPRRGVDLRCHVPGGTAEVTAVLLGPDGARWARRGRGEIEFSGLLPGRYWLTWQSLGMMAARVPLDLRTQGEVSVLLAHGRSST